MKRNKKLTLTAIAAMGVVAMGVGGAGTFAWFTVGAANQTAGVAATRDNIATVGNSYTSGGLKFTVEFSNATLTGIIPTDANGDVYYLPYEGAPSSAWIKDETASVSSDRCKTIDVSLKVELVGDSATPLDDLLTALGSTQYTVTVTPGTNVKISYADAAGAYAATQGVANASFKVTAAELLAAKAAGYKVSDTLYVAVYGGSSTANDGVISQESALTLSGQVSGGSIGA